MNRLQLATVLSWAGDEGLQGRKRLQKVVFFLQEAGCPLECRFSLHHFGPYSRDVAHACDELVAAGLVEERGGPTNGGKQYVYALKPHTLELLQALPSEEMTRFKDHGENWLRTDLWQLELGSTILFYFRHTKDWDEALGCACQFKQVPVDAAPNQAALALAQSVSDIGST